jgi:hypothetical protein
MRRIVFATLGCAVLAIGAVPALAGGGTTSADRAEAPVQSVRSTAPALTTTPTARAEPDQETRDDRREHLKLGCRGTATDSGPAIGCRWSPSRHPSVAGYRLWRSDGGGRHVIFRSADATRYVDEAVRPGQVYAYWVEAVDEDGTTIGTGGPVRAQAPARKLEMLRMACRGTVTDRGPVIACRWSESQQRAFAGYRLWRADGEDRQLVFRTADRAATRFVDTDVRPDHPYAYTVEVVDAGGETIGRGGPVRAQASGSPPRREQPARTGPIDATDDRPEEGRGRGER